MLPFLKKKEGSANSGLIIKTRTPDESPSEESDDSAAIDSCSSKLIRAVHSRDTKAVSAALKDAFDILGSMPEESESDSPSPHSYDAQNILAGDQE